MMKYYIEQRTWEVVHSYLLTEKGLHHRDAKALKNFLEGVWYVMRRLLPRELGRWRSVHRRFKRWCDNGVWQRLFRFASRHPSMELIMIDSTIVRAHSSAAGYKKDSSAKQALGRSRGGYSTKVHVVADAQGRPLKIVMTPGQKNDIEKAEELAQDYTNTTVIADKGYDSDGFVKYLDNRGCTAVIPPRRNRKNLREYDRELYKERNLIERVFGKAKNFRRAFSRFEKTVIAFLGCWYFVGIMIWLG